MSVRIAHQSVDGAKKRMDAVLAAGLSSMTLGTDASPEQCVSFSRPLLAPKPLTVSREAASKAAETSADAPAETFAEAESGGYRTNLIEKLDAALRETAGSDERYLRNAESRTGVKPFYSSSKQPLSRVEYRSRPPASSVSASSVSAVRLATRYEEKYTEKSMSDTPTVNVNEASSDLRQLLGVIDNEGYENARRVLVDNLSLIETNSAQTFYGSTIAGVFNYVKRAINHELTERRQAQLNEVRQLADKQLAPPVQTPTPAPPVQTPTPVPIVRPPLASPRPREPSPPPPREPSPTPPSASSPRSRLLERGEGPSTREIIAGGRQSDWTARFDEIDKWIDIHGRKPRENKRVDRTPDERTENVYAVWLSQWRHAYRKNPDRDGFRQIATYMAKHAWWANFMESKYRGAQKRSKNAVQADIVAEQRELADDVRQFEHEQQRKIRKADRYEEPESAAEARKEFPWDGTDEMDESIAPSVQTPSVQTPDAARDNPDIAKAEADLFALISNFKPTKPPKPQKPQKPQSPQSHGGIPPVPRDPPPPAEAPSDQTPDGTVK